MEMIAIVFITNISKGHQVTQIESSSFEILMPLGKERIIRRMPIRKKLGHHVLIWHL